MPIEREGEGEDRHEASEREKRTQFSEVTFAALTGEASGEHLSVAESNRGSTSGMYGEDGRLRAIRDVADGGYVIDLRPLADHPQITSWVFQAPMPNGRIEGDDIDRLPDDVRSAASEMATPFGLQGAFRDLALLASAKVGEPQDGSAGPFDRVSATYRALYWGSRGALIGKRIGPTLHWSDGTEQPIEPKPPQNSPSSPHHPTRRPTSRK